MKTQFQTSWPVPCPEKSEECQRVFDQTLVDFKKFIEEKRKRIVGSEVTPVTEN